MLKHNTIFLSFALTLIAVQPAFAQDGQQGGFRGGGRFNRGDTQDENAGPGGGGARFGRRGGGGMGGNEDGGGGGPGGGFGRGGGGFGRGGGGLDAAGGVPGQGGFGGFNRGMGNQDSGGGAGGGFGRGGFGGPGGGGPGGMGSADFIRRLDTNGNGIIDPAELNDRTRMLVERAGLSTNAPIPVEKLIAAMDQMRNENGGGGKGNRRDSEARSGNNPNSAESGSGNTKSGNSKAAPSGPPLVPTFGEAVSLPPVPGFGEAVVEPAEKAASHSTITPKQMHYRTPSERLPEGLPDWFLRLDANGDGQIMMHEFATTWTDAKVAEFAKYDLNGDGVITAEECIKVAGKK